jgi:cytochrome c553
MRVSTHLAARLLALSIVAAGLGAAASCSDPVHDSEVAALGGETDVPQSEYHRAGQPCGVCHGQEGPAKLQFSLAGTVFLGPDCRVGAGGAHVLIIDSVGHQPPGEVVTNCVGNFEIAQDVWAPEFPILAWVQDGSITKKMMSHVSRETACNQCHKDPNSDNAPGHIYMNDVEPTSYTVDCPYSPNVPTNGCNDPMIVNNGTGGKARSAGGDAIASDVAGATPALPPVYIWTSPGAPGAAAPAPAPALTPAVTP